jgi:cytochrome c oxidase subunit 2
MVRLDFLLLCNKICGSSHYNMQMKITVVSPEDYKSWLAGKTTMNQQMKDAAEPEEPATPEAGSDSKMVQELMVVAAK